MGASVTIVRVYLSESDRLLEEIISKLHDDEQVMGVTVFRGISGFGKSGQIHSSSLLDLMADLPIVVEFFDEPAKAESIVEHLTRVVGPKHIVSWSAQLSN